jgi:hypothetical protein
MDILFERGIKITTFINKNQIAIELVLSFAEYSQFLLIFEGNLKGRISWRFNLKQAFQLTL